MSAELHSRIRRNRPRVRRGHARHERFFTIQGVIFDSGSASPRSVSLTNAMLLHME